MEENSDLALEQPVIQRADPKGADPLLRTGAFAIDAAIVSAVCWIWNLLIWRLMPLQAVWLGFAGVIVIVLAYYGWATARRNHTPGQGFAGLTLARVDYHPLTPRRAYVRMLIFMTTSGMALPNLIIMLIDKRRRTIHDFATKTWVYALPEYDSRRRIVTRAAGVFLILLVSARAILALADRLETQQPLTMKEIAAGLDGKKP